MTAGDPARWRHLGVGLLGLVAACAVQNGLPFLTVALRAEGLSLTAIGLLVSAPTAGLVLSLLAWVRWPTGTASGWCSVPGSASPRSP
ncbi:MAG: hypothetical protein M3Q47_07030 [Actinomycetota bacterium]|nr:hypothetical protein [Actinomycetota bacterium]